MTSVQLRLFIDECLPEELIDAYLKPHIELCELPVQVVHYREKYGPNSRWKDRNFVPDLGRDRRWLIISNDKENAGFNSMRCLCRQHGVNLLYLSSGVQKRAAGFFCPQILAHWDRILAIADLPRGTHYSIALSKTGYGTNFQVVECPDGYTLKKGRCDCNK